MTRARILLIANNAGDWVAYGISHEEDAKGFAWECFNDVNKHPDAAIAEHWIEVDIPDLPVIQGEVTA